MTDIIMFDNSLIYMLPMSKLEENENQESYTECKLVQHNFQCIFTAIAPGFRSKAFVDKYVQYLIYSGYIKIK